MKRRGAARVVAMDSDADYLNQARFAAEVSGVELEFHELSVYDVATLRERFDIVLFLGVFYHLRHPLLALIHEHVARDLLVFQSMQRGSAEIELEKDYVRRGRSIRPAGLPEAAFHRAPLRRRSDQLVGAEPGLLGGPVAQRRLRRPRPSGRGGVHLSPAGAARRISCGLSKDSGGTMLEAVMIWNEPNNKSHWDFAIDPDWSAFAQMARLAGTRSRRKIPGCRACWAASRRSTPCSFRTCRARASSTSTPWPCTGFRWTGTIGCSTSGRTS